MTWVLSRQGEPDEHYTTKTAAMGREKYLKFKGVANVCAWEQSDEVGPHVETRESA